jgi:hypothetical protein
MERETIKKQGANYLILGLVLGLKINIIGEIYIGEIAAFIYILNNLKISLLSRYKYSELWIFCILFMLSQIISDFINNTIIIDSVKGVMSPLIFTITIFAVIKLVERKSNKVYYILIGTYISYAINDLISPSAYYDTNPWKWGIGLVLIQIFSAWHTFILKKYKNITLIIFIIIYFYISIINSSRSLALFSFFSLLLFYIFKIDMINELFDQFKKRFGLIKIITVLLISIIVINEFSTLFFQNYSSIIASQNDYSENYLSQSGGNYGILLGGRSEILVSSLAFIEKPWFGHGSWAKDPSGYYGEILIGQLYSLGYLNSDYHLYDTEFIPVHSYIMGGFVWAGVLGGLYWLVFLIITFIEFLRIKDKIQYYYIFNITMLIWNVIFSPFGANNRWISAVFFGILCSYKIK